MRVVFLFILSFYSCTAVINHLNESTYALMPPLYGLDKYSQCLVPEEGTYCMLRLDLISRDNSTVMNIIREYSANKLKHFDHTYLQRGVCVTKTCKHHIKNNSLYTTQGLMKTLERCLNESIYTDYGIDAKLSSIYYCDKNNHKDDNIDLWDWIVLGIFGAVFVINGIATLYDFTISKCYNTVRANPYILSFSIIQNWKRLLSPEPEEIREKRLTSFHGIKVLTLFLMFVAHVTLMNGLAFNVNTYEFEQAYDNTYYQLIFNGLVVIQVFFVISGFLLVYNLEHYCEKHDLSWAMAIKIWFMRFWRLTPAYALTIAFMSTWLRHLGSGPLWRLIVGTVVNDCRSYWWTHLLYFNNYVTDEHFCAFHTWHLAADTQLFCVGLLAYLMTRRGGRNFILGVLVILGIIFPALNVWWWDLDALVLLTPETYRTMNNDTFFSMHVFGHNNLVSYALGMATASLVFRLQRKGVILADNRLCQLLCLLMVPSIVLLFYSGSIFFADDWVCPLAIRMLYAAAHRLIIGLVVAFTILAIALRVNSLVRSFFEASVWVVPSRLSYAVYLLHLIPIHVFIGLRQGTTYASTFDMTLIHFGTVLFTFMIALPFSLMVEAPILRLMKISPKPDEQTKV